jgi:hypothetical protein
MFEEPSVANPGTCHTLMAPNVFVQPGRLVTAAHVPLVTVLFSKPPLTTGLAGGGGGGDVVVVVVEVVLVVDVVLVVVVVEVVVVGGMVVVVEVVVVGGMVVVVVVVGGGFVPATSRRTIFASEGTPAPLITKIM